jgi:hypothetical protein
MLEYGIIALSMTPSLTFITSLLRSSPASTLVTFLLKRELMSYSSSYNEKMRVT